MRGAADLHRIRVGVGEEPVTLSIVIFVVCTIAIFVDWIRDR